MDFRSFRLILFVASLLSVLSEDTLGQNFCRLAVPDGPCIESYFDRNQNTNKYYVRVYTHVVRNSNSGGAYAYDSDMVNESLKYLDQAFNPHNIFFVRAKYDNNCINYIDEGLFFDLGTGVLVAGNILATYDKQDGINLYYFADLPNTGGGATTFTDINGKPSNVVYIVGSRDYISVGRSFGVAHEVGHCLSLCHTFHDPITPADNANCLKNSDLVCDTPADFDSHMNEHVNSTTCVWTNPDPVNKPNYQPSASNIMSYSLLSCMKQFTEEQGTVMRNSLNPSLLNPLNITTFPAYIHNSNFVYSSDSYFDNDLVIENGATVTINPGVTLSFATNRKLLIKSGSAVLLLGKVTSSCGAYWQGVEIEGSPIVSQAPANQGRLITYAGSSIENALIGINCPSGKSGGIIDCKWTTFRNNNIAVFINKYELSNAYKAKFSNCTFIVDNNFKPNYRGGFEAFAKLNLVRGVSFNACTFENTNGSITNKRDGKGYGIYSLDAGFNLTYGATQGNACCIGSNVTGLSYGVYQSNMNGKVYAYNVDNTTFSNCYTGIFASAAFGGKMVTNTFNMGGTAQYSGQTEQYGIALNGNMDGFILEENTFSHNLGGTLQTIGTSCVGTGTFNNITRRNHYYGLTRANEADQDNGTEDLDNTPRGLTYLCNTNAGTQRFDFLNKESLKRVQGFPSIANGIPAILASGNTFTHSFANTFSDFNNSWDFDINYHHLDNIASQTPAFTQNLVNIPSLNNTCIQKYCAQPCIKVAEEDRTTLKSAYFQNQDNYLSRLNSVSTSTPPTVYTEMNYYKTEADRAAYLVLDSYINDTLGYEEDTLRVWLGRLDTYTAKWRSNQAQTITLTTTEQNDWSNLQQIQTILQAESLNNLSTASINTLQTMANNPNGLSWVMAKNVLQENGIHNYPYIVDEPAVPRSDAKSFTKNVTVYPNPSNGNFTFKFDKLQKSGILSIWNSNGSKVLQKNIFAEETIQLNNENGIYFYSLLFESGLNITGKLLICK